MKPDKLYHHGRFWVAILSMVAALCAIFLSPYWRPFAMLHSAWDEWAIVAAGAYALFSLRRELGRS